MIHPMPIFFILVGSLILHTTMTLQAQNYVVQNEEGQYGVMDQATKTYTIPLQYDQMFTLEDCYERPPVAWFAAQKDGRWGVVEAHGKIIHPFEYEAINGLCEGRVVLKKEGAWISQSSQKTLKGDEVVFCCPEKEAELSGGLEVGGHNVSEQVLKHIKNTRQRTKKATDPKLRGLVEVSFIVEKDGSISKVNCFHADAPELKAVVLSSLKNIAEFYPARHDGKRVRSRVALPIYFNE